jgi:hypothetical protein
MAKKVTILGLIGLFIITSAFTTAKSSLIVGKWKYVSMQLPDSLKNDEETKSALAMVEVLMSDLTIEFKKDGTYEISVMGTSEEGKYVYNKAKGTLSMDSGKEEDKGMLQDAKLMQLNDKVMVLGDKQGNITFKRM